MRMWMVNPRLLCRQHLLGEHRECHVLIGRIKKGLPLRPYTEHGLVEPLSLISHHNALVAEMERRGYQHNSPLDGKTEAAILDLPNQVLMAQVDVQDSIRELCRRCEKCRNRIRRTKP